MAVDERSRHELHGKLEQVLGPKEAGTLMSYLPPVGWADVATKRDLDHLEAVLRAELDSRVGGLDSRIGGLDSRIGGLDARVGGLDARIGRLEIEVRDLRSEVHSSVRTLMAVMSTLFVTLAGLAFAAAKLT
jgi:hypothetical protein